MKKVISFAALVLAAAGSWAFYPKTAEPTGCVMVIGRLIIGGSSIASVVTIEPDGKVVEDELNARSGSKNKLNLTLSELHKAELLKVNQLLSTGYRLVSTNATGVQRSESSGTLETIYLLSK